MRYQVSFQKLIWGVPFVISSINIRRARSAERALRAAELRFSREHGLASWRELADQIDVEVA